MATQPEFIESTAGQIAAELARRGISSDQPVMVTIDREQGVLPGRLASRIHVVADGIASDEEIDRVIEKAREEVQSLIR